MGIIEKFALQKKQIGKTMVKIHILGGPGSGKTTLGQDLSSRLHVPHHDLDQLKIDDFLSIAQRPAWITEAIYLISTDPLLHQADYIVLLEIAWYVAVWRVLRRHITKSLHGTNPYPTKLLFDFLKFTYSYYTGSDPSTAEFVRMDFEEHKDSIDTTDAELLLMRLEKYKSAIPLLTAELTRLYLERYKEKVFVVRNDVDRANLLELLTKREH